MKFDDDNNNDDNENNNDEYNDDEYYNDDEEREVRIEVKGSSDRMDQLRLQLQSLCD